MSDLETVDVSVQCVICLLVSGVITYTVVMSFSGVSMGQPNGSGVSMGQPNGSEVSMGQPNGSGVSMGQPNGSGVSMGQPNGSGTYPWRSLKGQVRIHGVA